MNSIREIAEILLGREDRESLRAHRVQGTRTLGGDVVTQEKYSWGLSLSMKAQVLSTS